jgi:hypothetical protein
MAVRGSSALKAILGQLGHDALEGDAGLHGGLLAQFVYGGLDLNSFCQVRGRPLLIN